MTIDRLDDPINQTILAISEDQLAGFQRDPFGEIARRTDLPVGTVVERVRALLAAGVIRRVRQTLIATSLADGALVAWQVEPERLHAAFDWLFQRDPFSGHVVIRSTDAATAGADYRLWTTLKAPQGFSLERHAAYLAGQIGATRHRLMPAKRLFVLGVGHVRRRGVEPGAKTDGPAQALTTDVAPLSEVEWRVLGALKREFAVAEIVPDLWRARAAEAGLALDEFSQVAEALQRRGLLGRFSTFLEHVKPTGGGEAVTRYNALFHWAVPPGRELEAGEQVGRHHILTHAYWREGGSEFSHVNIMAVAHGLDKDLLLDHKRAIDEHLSSIGMPVSYTNVFWGGRSEIKPSEILPTAYEAWCREQGIDVEAMREGAAVAV